uniref:Maestro heat-like repeat-containing protein family member 1-like 1 n=1 Tax=Hypotaenidia okinawae TaxID=2861861 RepID=A0A6G1RZC6_9GRUI
MASSQGCPGATIATRPSLRHPSKASPARPVQRCLGDASPGKTILVAIPVRPVPAPSHQGQSWCHPSKANPGATIWRGHPSATIPVRPSQCHHPSEASLWCPGEVNPDAVPVRLSQCHHRSEAILLPSQCHHPSEAGPGVTITASPCRCYCPGEVGPGAVIPETPSRCHHPMAGEHPWGGHQAGTRALEPALQDAGHQTSP